MAIMQLVKFLLGLHLTAVELELVVEIVELLLDVCRTRTVLAHTEGQQHVDLKRRKMSNQTHV